MSAISSITQIIRSRRSVFPKNYMERPIEKPIIEEILENANNAPTHKLTQPWRFKVFTGESLGLLGQELADKYRDSAGNSFSEMKYQKTLQNPIRSACVIAICMQRDLEESVPEWEEIASVACAVQNMWLTCTAYGIGSYWSSPASIADMDDFLHLKEGEHCLGFFYMGYYEGEVPASPRSRMEDKVVWV
jgi:nitroreductase